ncbi:MAG: pilus assembly protein PilM [Deltaproteobacteria bacterium]|nr:pilus assembly protein PilM [Deltaproteobacteria bacterium]
MPRLIAIDLGTYAAKASVYLQAGRRSGIEGQYAAAVPQDGTEIPTLGDRLLALDALLDEHPEWANPGNEIGLVWPSAFASLRSLTLPFSDRSQVERTLPFTVEGEVPFDLEDMVLGWRPLSQDEQTHAVVSLVRRELLGEWLEALAERGLDPSTAYLDGELLGYWARSDDVLAVIDVGHAHTVVTLTSGGKVLSVRSIDVAGRSFTLAIQQVLGCSWAEAEAHKHGGDLPPAVQQATDGQMGLLLAEVRSTLIAAEDRLGVEVEHALLTGSGALLEPLPSYLAQDLGISMHRVTDEGGQVVPPSFATSTALNMVEAKGVPRDAMIQLRLGDLAYKGGVNVLRAVMVYGSAGLVFFLIATVVMFVVQYRSLAMEQSEMTERIRTTVSRTFPDVQQASLKSTTQAMAIASERTRDAIARSEVLADTTGTPPTIDKVYELTKAFPPPNEVTVEVSELTITPATISFTAETDGYAPAALVEESLRKQPLFKDVAKGNDRKVRDKVSFTVTIPLTGDESVEEEG